jgi:hypothetical protein
MVFFLGGLPLLLASIALLGERLRQPANWPMDRRAAD